VRTLEAQALEPIAGPSEMGSSHATMVSTISRASGYVRYFTQAFGDAKVTIQDADPARGHPTCAIHA
jgi:cytochrome c peroxidase